MTTNNNSKVVYYPIKLLLGFLVFSELLYFIGPVDYKVSNNLLLVIYLFILNYVLYAGFRVGIKRYVYNPVRRDFSNRALKTIIILGLSITVLRLFRSVGSFSLSALFQTLFYAASNSGAVYRMKLESATTTVWTYFFMLVAPIVFLAQTGGVYYWNRHTKFYKFLVILIILIEIVYWVCRGTRKGLFDILLVVFSMIIASNPSLITSPTKNRHMRYWLLASVLLFLFFFIISNLSRYGLSVSEYADFELNSLKPFYRDHLPRWISLSLVNITGYLCQGYRALSLALNDTFGQGVFCFSFGFGSNWFEINFFENAFGINMLPYTYQAYLASAYGIDEMVNWHTLYLWLANDFTFLGVPFVIYLLGYIFSHSWLDSINHANQYGAPLSALCVTIIAYAFANNQVLSFSFVTFFVVVFMYVYSRKH